MIVMNKNSRIDGPEDPAERPAQAELGRATIQYVRASKFQGGINEPKDSQNDRIGNSCIGYRARRVLASASTGPKGAVSEHGSA
jgi:hypothetical protein